MRTEQGAGTGMAARGVRAVPGILVLFSCAAPLCALALAGTARGTGERLGHLARTVLPMQVSSSMLVGAGAVIGALALSSGGVLCGLFDFPGRRWLGRLSLVPLLLPPWFLAVIFNHRFGLSGTSPLIVTLAVGVAPLVQLLSGAALGSIPVQHLHVLRTAGRARPIDLCRHLLPLAAPALTAASVLVFLLAWGDLDCARILAVPTLAVGMHDQWFGIQQESAGASVVVLLVVSSLPTAMLLWAVVSRRGWAGRAKLQRGSMRRVRLGGAAAVVPWALGAPLLVVGVVVPGVVIGQWTAASLDRVPLEAVLGDVLRTILLAVVATALSAALALVLLRDHAVVPGRAAALASVLALATFAIPSIALALGVLRLFPQDDGPTVLGALGATPLPLVLALGLRFCAVFLGAGHASLLRTARAHVEVARVNGTRTLFGFARLFRPFLARSCLAAACFVFLLVLQDVSLSLILQPFDFTTVAMRLFSYSQTQRIPESSVWVVCSMLVGVYPLSLLARFADPEGRSTARE